MDLIKTRSFEQIAQHHYSEGSEKIRTARASANEYLQGFLSFRTFLGAAFVLGSSLIGFKLFEPIAKILYDMLDRMINRPTLIEESNVPLSLREWLGSFFFSTRSKLTLRNNLEKAILPKVIKDQIKERIKEFVFIFDHNSKLTRKERAAGKGLGYLHFVLEGPPGVGKSFSAEGYVYALVQQRSNIHVIRVSGSKPSAIAEGKMDQLLLEIYRRAKYNYEKYGIVTILMIDEYPTFFKSRFDPNAKEQNKIATTRILNIMTSGRHEFLHFVFTSNLPADEAQANKVTDPALRNRLKPGVINFDRIPDTEEGRQALAKVFMLYLKEVAVTFHLKIDKEILEFVMENIQVLMRIDATPRFMAAKAKGLVAKVAIKNSKKKKKVLTIDDIMEFFDNAKEVEDYAQNSSYGWADLV